MRKLICLAICLVMLAGCASSKKTTKTSEYTAEKVELYGYGVGKSVDENTARGLAITAALGDLSVKMDAKVRTASSNYQKQTGEFNKTLYEALAEVVSTNHLQGVYFKGDRIPVSSGREYVFRVEARLDHTIFKKNVESILDDLSATESEREAFKREMFGE